MVENGEAKEEDTKDSEKERAKDQARACMGWTSWAHGEAMIVGTRAAEEISGDKSHGEAKVRGTGTACGQWE